MKLLLEMSPEAAAFVRKMYENGELDDIVASMVKVEEPVADAAGDELGVPTYSGQRLVRNEEAERAARNICDIHLCTIPPYDYKQPYDNLHVNVEIIASKLNHRYGWELRTTHRIKDWIVTCMIKATIDDCVELLHAYVSGQLDEWPIQTIGVPSISEAGDISATAQVYADKEGWTKMLPVYRQKAEARTRAKEDADSSDSTASTTDE